MLTCQSLMNGSAFIFNTALETTLYGIAGYVVGGAFGSPPHNQKLAAKVWAISAMAVCIFSAINEQITGGRTGNKKLYLALRFTSIVALELAVIAGYKYQVVNGLAASIAGPIFALKIVADLMFNQFWRM